MSKFAFALAALAAIGFTTTGCQKAPDDAAVKQLEELNNKMDELIAATKSRPAGAAPARPQARPGRPDPAAVYSVPIEGAPYVGPEDAKITVVKAFEFACPFCQRVRPTLDQLMEDYKGDIKVVYKHYIVHPQTATIPAYAACAAQQQGKYKEMYNAIWDKGFSAGRNLSKENMEKLAGELGLNMNKFKQDMDSDTCKKQVQQDQAELAKVGTRGTPAFYINGRFLSGAQPVDRFKAIIDEELKKVNADLKKGAKLDDYYAEKVLKNGKKSL